MAATGQQRNEPPSGTALSDPVVTLEDSSAPHAAGASGPAAAVATGDCLAGRFVIEKELGRGAGGTVFVARDRMLDRPVAIKILNHAPDAEALARFAQEARAAGALDHANVLVVHDVGVDRGAPFIVSELLRGRTLRARLAEGRLSVEEALGYALQLARGLAATHDHGIVHRDLKPENLFLLEDGRLKILDFGLAKLLPSAQPEGPGSVATVTGAIVGTVPYMSPEQVRGQPADARSDVFAFGAILHEMLSGARAFPGKSAIEIGHAILNGPPSPLPEGTPVAVRALVHRCLAKRPEDRFQSARELVPVLETLAPPSLPVASRRWRTVVRIATALTVLLAGAVAWRYFAPSPAREAVVAAPRRLAVLPFRAIGANADGEALCAGLGEILTNRLRQIEHLHGSLNVISAADVLNERVASARDARSAFGATLAVSGSLQWSGERILVAANLVDTSTQVLVEARDFEAPSGDIPALGRLLVQTIAAMLDLEVRPEPQGGQGDGLAASPGASALYLQGRGYLQRYDRVENLDRALAAFDGVLQEDPAFALAHAGKAEAWLRRDRIIRDPSALQQARASSRRALELGPNLSQVNLTAGLVHLAGGEHEEAIESLQRALRIEPANADAMRELGNAYDAAGRTAEAEATFRRAVQLRPESWAAIRDLGVFYNRHGRLEDALTSFQRVVAIAPDSYNSWSSLGGVYLRLGRHAEAAAALEKSLALRPTSKAFMNLGSIRYFEGRFGEASDAYRKAAQLTPSDERFWGALADALRRVPGNSDEVAGAYRQAIALAEQQTRLNPRDSDLRSRLAMYRAYAGDNHGADRDLAEALRLTPHDGAVLFRAALIHEQFGRRDLALRAIDEALRVGYSREEIGKAPALESLRQDPRYARMAVNATAPVSPQ